jgi:glycosyltransferase involved in cell wall biosynthesis
MKYLSSMLNFCDLSSDRTHLKAYYHMSQSVELAARQHVDIIHTHLSASASLYIFPLTAQLAVPHVTTLHSRFPFDHVQSWTGDADTFYLKRWASAVPIVTISNHARSQVPPELHVVGTVHNGLSMQHYRPTSQHQDTYLVWLSRFVPEKGPHLAIAAAREAQRPLILAGTIDQSVQRSVSYFHEVIEPLIDQQQIRYIGPVNRQQKVNLLSRASGFLNPIEWEEPFGMVMIDAMALGCPVISFARGAAPELIVHGETGFLVHNLDEMVQAIPRLATLDRMATRLHVQHHFSASIMAKHYVKIYQQVIAGSEKVAE